MYCTVVEHGPNRLNGLTWTFVTAVWRYGLPLPSSHDASLFPMVIFANGNFHAVHHTTACASDDI